MAPTPRELREDDVLYRVLRPGEHDEGTPLPSGFADTSGYAGQRSETLSFFAASYCTPREMLRKLSGNRMAKRLCGTGPARPSPDLMYDTGYRVAVLPAALVLHACAEPRNVLSLKPDATGNTVQDTGHVEVFRGDLLSAYWARHARILSKDETLP
jgi:hypothetical protein